MKKPLPSSQPPVTEKEAQLHWYHSGRRSLSKKQLSKLYDKEGALTAKWEQRGDNVHLVGDGLTVVFTRSGTGQVTGAATKA